MHDYCQTHSTNTAPKKEAQSRANPWQLNIDERISTNYPITTNKKSGKLLVLTRVEAIHGHPSIDTYYLASDIR